MSQPDYDDLYKRAVAAACAVLDIPLDEADEWEFRPKNLWRKRPDGYHEWHGKRPPLVHANYAYRPVRDELRKCWVMLPRDATPQ